MSTYAQRMRLAALPPRTCGILEQRLARIRARRRMTNSGVLGHSIVENNDLAQNALAVRSFGLRRRRSLPGTGL